jgi:hypothetical protein
VWVQVDGSQRFHVHEFGQVQDVPDACRTHSVVLCVVFLLFRKRRKEQGERGERKNSFLAAPGLLGLLCAIKS